jgi:23S rRNA U2552 (ribose-2'-O)-methylase RlmE/FtsJ
MTSYDISQKVFKNSELLNLVCKYVDTTLPEQPDTRYGYDIKLNHYRNYIDNIDSDNWKKVRWYINEYDFVVKDPIINRAFYKYWEIINEFEIFENYTDNDLIFHCAEAPGGFIQGSNIYLQLDTIDKPDRQTKQIVDDDGFITLVKKGKRFQNTNYKIYTMSLNKDLPQYKMYNLPNYNRNILNKHVYITYGKDATGDINNWNNINTVQSLVDKQFYLVTADGGFDEGTDFNNKEQLHYNLIISEIYAAISIQANHGHFILKVFDVLTDTSIHLLYLLTLCYKNVYIYKPNTSRPTNSEKYIICKDFILNNEERKFVLTKMNDLQPKMSKTTAKYISIRLFSSIPETFIEKIREMNILYLNKQCDYLDKAIQLCNDPNFVSNYEECLSDIIQRRRSVFRDWEHTYNLNSYV